MTCSEVYSRSIHSCTYIRVLEDVEELVDRVVSLKPVRIDKMAVSLQVRQVHEDTLKYTKTTCRYPEIHTDYMKIP